MKIRNVITIIAVTAILTAVVVPLAQEDDDPFITAFGNSRYNDCGLDKLTPSERRQLHGLITGAVAESYLEEGAVGYMQKKGWSKVAILGAVPSNDGFDDKHILISHKYDLYVLDPMIVPYLPDPGMYWGKNSGSSWTLVYPDGGTCDFWGKALK